MYKYTWIMYPLMIFDMILLLLLLDHIAYLLASLIVLMFFVWVDLFSHSYL
jgi:hypothetical protein